MMENETMTRSERARAYFLEGYNCAQAVALAFADRVNMDREALAALASSFGVAAGDFGGILVHGLAFGLLCVGSQMYIDSYAPPELKNQAQGLVMLLTNGVGLFVSNFVFHLILGANVATATPLRHDWTPPYLIALAMSVVLMLAMVALFRPRSAPPGFSDRGEAFELR